MLRKTVDDFMAALAHGEGERGAGSPNTILAYRNDLHQLCDYLTMRQILVWSYVSPEDITDYLHTLRKECAYTEKTIARKFCTLKSFFCYMRMQDLIPFDPVASLSPAPLEKASPRPLSSTQLTDLLQQMEVDTPTGLRDLAMCHVLYASGMYTSELVALNVQHFDHRRLCIYCPGRIGAHKRERIYQLPVESARVVALYLEQARPGFMRFGQEDALFLNHHGARMTRQGFWLVIKGYALRAGIAHLSPRILRHSFALTGLPVLVFLAYAMLAVVKV